MLNNCTHNGSAFSTLLEQLDAGEIQREHLVMLEKCKVQLAIHHEYTLTPQEIMRAATLCQKVVFRPEQAQQQTLSYQPDNKESLEYNFVRFTALERVLECIQALAELTPSKLLQKEHILEEIVQGHYCLIRILKGGHPTVYLERTGPAFAHYHDTTVKRVHAVANGLLSEVLKQYGTEPTPS